MSTRHEPLNARSRRTRRAILAAVGEVLEQDGTDALTMGEVASRSGISRRALYLHFASRADLVAALLGEIRREQSLEDSLAGVWEAGDSLGALRAWADHLARHGRAALRVEKALELVTSGDPIARGRYERELEERLREARRLTRMLASFGELDPAHSEHSAADLVFALSSPEVVERLLIRRGWSDRRFAEAMTRTLAAAVLSEQAAAVGSRVA